MVLLIALLNACFRRLLAMAVSFLLQIEFFCSSSNSSNKTNFCKSGSFTVCTFVSLFLASKNPTTHWQYAVKYSLEGRFYPFLYGLFHPVLESLSATFCCDKLPASAYRSFGTSSCPQTKVSKNR
jgi:hypothetical protein